MRTFSPMESSPSASDDPEDNNRASRLDFLERTSIPYLCQAQNKDGGWGFQAGRDSRTEPTAWALLALHESSSIVAHDDAEALGVQFLERSQLSDGSWPSSPESTEGCWVTSLACWSLLRNGRAPHIVSRGTNWLCNDRPGDARLWWRLLRRLRSSGQVVSQNNAYYGWSWTPRTASWVEPTSLALIVLRENQLTSSNARLLQRRQLAEAMLYDRMCPGGGWNCGNPIVYGAPGEPQISSTVWALLALREHAARTENQQSLAWLTANWARSQTPASLALAYIALDAYGRLEPAIGASLRAAYGADAMWGVPEVAWSVLALNGSQSWLAAMPNGKSS